MTIEIGGFIGLAALLVGLFAWLRQDISRVGERITAVERGQADLRERMAVVFQDFFRYDLSAADNIGLGQVSALDARPRVMAAATKGGAHDGHYAAMFNTQAQRYR